MKEEEAMEKVYIVWYRNTEIGKTGIWGVYSDPGKAEEIAAYIDIEWDWPAWWNEEIVQ